MAKLLSAFAVLVFLTPAFAWDQDSGVGRLRDVRTVYVAELGKTDRAKTLRQEIIKSLKESERFRLTDAADKADAVLTVSIKNISKNVDWPYEAFGEAGIQTGSKVVQTSEIVLSLNSHQQRSLWAAKFDSASFSGKTETHAARSLANAASKKLLKAVEKDRRKRQ